ncbi:Thioredoxin H2 [Glycine soja]|uniref:Thioredoxin H2 n=1 Tax=Glycine soja TaxID=3848 RepID=A0A445J5F9_GLYSO|nr:Thioredoxin H2 [Glycine soja]
MGSYFSSISATVVEAENPHVRAFHSAESWQTHFKQIKDSPKLLHFTVSWCPPCKFIAPLFNEMAAKFTDAEFIKIDVDELSDVAKEFNVEAMPTFVLWKKGKEVDRVVGAEKDELKNKIEKHYQL